MPPTGIVVDDLYPGSAFHIWLIPHVLIALVPPLLIVLNRSRWQLSLRRRSSGCYKLARIYTDIVRDLNEPVFRVAARFPGATWQVDHNFFPPPRGFLHGDSKRATRIKVLAFPTCARGYGRVPGMAGCQPPESARHVGMPCGRVS